MNPSELADRFGTPLYAFDLDVIRDRVAAVRSALGELVLLYAMKANPHPAILEALEPIVDGLDVASTGELAAARAAGYDPARLNIAGPGKSDALLRSSIAAGVGSIRAESIDELEDIATMAAGMSRTARVSLRVNPTEVPHAFRVKMGGGPSAFGVEPDQIAGAASVIEARDALSFVGTHVFAGSECTSASALWSSFATALEVAEEAATQLAIQRVDLGGGFGVSAPLDLDALGSKLQRGVTKFRATTGIDAPVAIELGRYLVADAGVYVASVQRVKRSRGQTFAILDGGFNHVIAANEPLLGAHRPAPRLLATGLRQVGPVQVCGPLCTPLDTFGELEWPTPKRRDRVVFDRAGAYGVTFSPAAFLGHPPPRTVIIDGGEVRVG